MTEASGIPSARLIVAGRDIAVEGRAGASPQETLVMIHGWPDTLRVWDGTAAALADRYRCVRITLPGFDVADAPRAHTLAEITELIHQVVRHVGSGAPVTLLMHVRTAQAEIRAAMGYPYWITWTGTYGSHRAVRTLQPRWPVFFAYGERKPMMFHSPHWAAGLATQPGCRVQGFRAGHWVMLDAKEEFHTVLREWLEATA